MKSTVTDIAIVIVSTALMITVAFGLTERRGASACVSTSPHILIDAGHGGLTNTIKV